MPLTEYGTKSPSTEKHWPLDRQGFIDFRNRNFSKDALAEIIEQHGYQAVLQWTEDSWWPLENLSSEMELEDPGDQRDYESVLNDRHTLNQWLDELKPANKEA